MKTISLILIQAISDINSDVDEYDQPDKRSKTGEDDFMETSRSKRVVNVADSSQYPKILANVISNINSAINGKQWRDSTGITTKLRRRFKQSLEDFFKKPKENNSDMEVDNSDDAKSNSDDEKNIKVENQRTIDWDSTKEIVKRGENSLQVRAINFIFDSGVNSLIGEIIQGMREYGACLKGQKVRIILPPDHCLSITKNGNLYEIMNPMPISEKLTKSQVKNVILCREIRLSMIKEENDVQTI